MSNLPGYLDHSLLQPEVGRTDTYMYMTDLLPPRAEREEKARELLFAKLGGVSCPDKRTVLQCRDRSLQPADAALIGALLSDGTSLPDVRELAFDQNGSLGDVGVSLFISSLSRSGLPLLSRLDLSRCGLSDVGIGHLAVALGRRVLRGIEVLVLSGNPIEGPGVDALACVCDMDSAPKLKVLELRSCRLGDAAAVSLASMIKRVPLLALFLDDNRIGLVGFRALSAMLATDPRRERIALNSLFCRWNALERYDEPEVAACLDELRAAVAARERMFLMAVDVRSGVAEERRAEHANWRGIAQSIPGSDRVDGIPPSGGSRCSSGGENADALSTVPGVPPFGVPSRPSPSEVPTPELNPPAHPLRQLAEAAEALLSSEGGHDSANARESNETVDEDAPGREGARDGVAKGPRDVKLYADEAVAILEARQRQRQGHQRNEPSVPEPSPTRHVRVNIADELATLSSGSGRAGSAASTPAKQTNTEGRPAAISPVKFVRLSLSDYGVETPGSA